MSRIGSLEKLNVASVLQRIETFTKTGLLVVKQDMRWVEFYCREGRLLCVGPIRTDATLGERLLHDGMISAQELQETMLAVGHAVPSETRIALTLMDLGFVTREELRVWVGKKTTDVLAAVLSWSTGELDFEENANAPSERLLVSLSISDLLAALLPKHTPPLMTTVVKNAEQRHILHTPQTQLTPQTPVEALHVDSTAKDVSQAPTLYDRTQFFAGPSGPPSHTPRISSSAETLLPISNNAITTDSIVPFVPPQTPPSLPRVPVMAIPPRRSLDISFMQPGMVLLPAEQSSLSEQYIRVTPEQWRLLTCVDGFTSLRDACGRLGMSAKDVCRVAGELIVEGIVKVVYPLNNEVQELSPTSQSLLQLGLGNGLVTPGYASTVQSPWSAMPPVLDTTPPAPSTGETFSQWGNGNGATFVHGQGWVPALGNTPGNSDANTSLAGRY